MKYLLDTNIIAYFIRGDRAVSNRLLQVGVQYGISAISVMELKAWATSSSKIETLVEAVISDLVVIDFDRATAELAGEIRQSLNSQGKVSAISDIMIAATALRRRLNLVTRNTKDFQAINHLVLENWLK